MDPKHPIGWQWAWPRLAKVAALVFGLAGFGLADVAPPTLLVVCPDRPPYTELAAAIRPDGWDVRVVDHIAAEGLPKVDAAVALGHEAWEELGRAGYTGALWVAMVSQRPVEGQGKAMGGLLLAPDMEPMLRHILHLFPGVHRIGVLFDRTKAPDLFPVARGVTLIPLPIDPEHPVWPSAQLDQEGIELLWPLPHSALYRAGVDDLLWVDILRHRLPAVAPSPQLMGRGPVVAWQYDWPLAGVWLSQAVALGRPQWGRHPVGSWVVDPHVARLIGIDPVRLRRRIEEWEP